MKYRDDFKIKFTKKPDFTVDAKNKTVKCYLTGDVITPNGLTGNRFIENFRMFAKGYAKCDNKDTFDPEVGKKIALARAESKLYWKVRTEVLKAYRDAEAFLDGADKFIDKAYGVMAHNESYVDRISYPEKKTTSQILSEKAKSQSRDEKGRFTACTNTEKSCDKKCKSDNGVIKIKINRK